MKMRRKILGMLLCVVLTALVGCGAKDSDKSGGAAKEESAKTESSKDSEEGDDKVIRVGCEATTPGWIQTGDDGSLEGYDFDVWQEIGKRTGYEIDYQVMDWDDGGCYVAPTKGLVFTLDDAYQMNYITFAEAEDIGSFDGASV